MLDAWHGNEASSCLFPLAWVMHTTFSVAWIRRRHIALVDLECFLTKEHAVAALKVFDNDNDGQVGACIGVLQVAVPHWLHSCLSGAFSGC